MNRRKFLISTAAFCLAAPHIGRADVIFYDDVLQEIMSDSNMIPHTFEWDVEFLVNEILVTKLLPIRGAIYVPSKRFRYQDPRYTQQSRGMMTARHLKPVYSQEGLQDYRYIMGQDPVETVGKMIADEIILEVDRSAALHLTVNKFELIMVYHRPAKMYRTIDPNIFHPALGFQAIQTWIPSGSVMLGRD